MNTLNEFLDEEANLDEVDGGPDYFQKPEWHQNLKYQVLKFIEANPEWKLSQLVNKFRLDLRFRGANWSDNGYGVGKFDLYTTETECGIQINLMSYRLPVKHQWTDEVLKNHPSNWEVIGWAQDI